MIAYLDTSAALRVLTVSPDPMTRSCGRRRRPPACGSDPRLSRRHGNSGAGFEVGAYAA
jgi:hypothetical protein